MNRRRLIQALASIALLPSLAWTRSERWVHLRVEGKYFYQTCEVRERDYAQVYAVLKHNLDATDEQIAIAMRESIVPLMITGRCVIGSFTREGT